MSNTTYDPADPRLTAYVLGELEDDERQAVEAQLEQCAESRAAVEEIRETVGLVTSALAAEPAESLTDEQRTSITDEAVAPATIQTARRSTWRGRTASFAAGVAATSVVILLVLPQLHRVVNQDSPQMNQMNGENAIIATTSSGSKYGDEEISYTLEAQTLSQSGDDLNVLGPSLNATRQVGQSHARYARSGRTGQKTLQESVTSAGYLGGGEVNGVAQVELAERSQTVGESLSVQSDLPPEITHELGNPSVAHSTGPAPIVDGFSSSARTKRVQDWDRKLNISLGMAKSAGKTFSAQPANSNTRIAGVSRFGVPVSEDNGEQAANGPGDETRLFSFYTGKDGKSKASANEQYLPIIENPFLSPNNDPLSTFSIDVDTASYSNVRRFLKHGQFPPANAVRIEELVNYFHYDYPEPADGQPFSVNLEAGPCPWNSEHRLVRVGLKGKEIDKSQRPPSNLVFLLDVSGSMRDANKLPLVKTAMEMLVGEMTEDDRIAIVTYSGQAGLKLPSTSGQDKTRIVDAIQALSAGGSTNGEAGIKLAYEQAVGNFIEDGTNRVILCTDGDFNVGTSGNAELVTLIQDKAKSNVFLSVFGFGMGNLKDGKLEQIADKGNGHYGYIDDEQEARKVFVEEAVGTLYTIAKDVKIQVEFNPQQVGGYRLIGYENRMLAAKDFNDDTKDAGEIGAGHTVTALYEVVPVDKLPAKKSVDNLKYQKPVQVNDDDKVAQELLTVKLRYKQPKEEKSTKIDFTLTDNKPRNQMPSVDFEWAASCAGFGLLLRNSQYRGQADFDLIRELAMGSRGDDESGRRREFLDLVYTAHALRARQLGQPIPPRDSLPEDKAREMAAVGGKYEKLLKRIEAPNDEAAYGPLTDYGYWAGKSWAGHEDLPKGHWVYVAPHWYIWGDAKEKQSAKPEKE